MDQIDEHFVKFAESLTGQIEYLSGQDDAEFLERQQKQVETLSLLETRFRNALVAIPGSLAIYTDFINFIRDECKNILDARPYFRERTTVFTPHISNALKTRDPLALSRFSINYRFIRFAMYVSPTHKAPIFWQLLRDIERVRTDLVVMNMPLAISRAKIFFSRTPKSHLDFMDLVQIAAVGIMSGIDKFVLPYSRMFRGVAIGRITGDLIEYYSQTMVHLYPSDKRILYNVNKLARTAEDIDYEEIANKVNAMIDPVKKVSALEVSDLVSAASCVSMEASSNDEESIKLSDTVAAPSDTRPDVIVEREQNFESLFRAIDTLSVFEQKFLRAWGVNVHNQ